MRILLIMDPGILIPPTNYGGIERMVALLAIEYRNMGHQVDLLATEGSAIEGCTCYSIGQEGFPPKKAEMNKAIGKAWYFLRKNRNRYDLIQNFGRLIYLLPVLNLPVKKLMCYQREITASNIGMLTKLPNRELFFSGCSANLVNRAAAPGKWFAVYNGVDFTRYGFCETVSDDAPLFFLGRIEKIKGCHTAIRVAKAVGKRLVIAGNVSSLPEERAYYETEIAPLIDGEQILHIGAVDDRQKNQWLRKAAALLFPIEWEEPFGIVMIESMACGTPVIALNRGAVNEVVTEGVTGYKVNDFTGMVEAVKTLSRIDREKCRLHAKQRFAITEIAKQYLAAAAGKKAKAVILSTHQPSANPRALKEYEALKAAGYEVKYLYPFNYEWAYRFDEQKFGQDQLPRQDFVCVGGDPYKRPVRYFAARLRFRLFRAFSFAHPFCRQMANARTAFDLWQAAVNYPAEIYLAHYSGALPGAHRAACKHGARLVFDAEDFHRGEMPHLPQQIKNVVATEEAILPWVDAITAASPMIAKAYKALYPQKLVTIVNNVFSVRNLQAVSSHSDKELKLFWFSQYIGPHRGLELVVKALNELEDQEITLTLLGNCQSEKYRQNLVSLAKRPERIKFMNAVPPEEVFRIAANHDIGLALEFPGNLNRQFCLTNKMFTYLLAGNGILASDTEAQSEFLQQNTGMGFLYRHDDPHDLATKIRMLYQDRQLLHACRANAQKAGAERFNWEDEQRTWLQLVKNVIYKSDPGSTYGVQHAEYTNTQP